MDDIFMRNVLKDSACTEYILKVIMDQDNLKLEDQILQADYKNLQGRSSILDCIALDNSGRKYNIEFQNADSGASLKRARYHGSLVDANTLETGQVPNDLPDTYIIFITTNDTLGFNLPICHINRTFVETGQSCPDQLHIIYVNSSVQDDTALGRLIWFCWSVSARTVPRLFSCGTIWPKYFQTSTSWNVCFRIRAMNILLRF